MGERGCEHRGLKTQNLLVIRAGQIEILHPLVPLGNSGTVPGGQRLESPWSGLGRGFNERVLGCVRI